MSDSIATTRISDLPENITIQLDSNYGQPEATGYKPMNIHPNPYDKSLDNQIPPPLPQAKQPTKSQYIPETPQFQLPSRDIPIDTSGYSYDENIQPNFIPKPKLTVDFVKDYENTNERDLQEHRSRKHRKRMVDDLLEEFQIPLLVVFLFFLFQLPILNTLIYKRLSFLPIFHTDGNPNFYGYVLKSLLFGSAFYFITKTTHFISEF